MSVQDILETKGSKVISIGKNDTLREAIGLLNQHNIGVIVVVDDQGNLSGILSERDIIRRSLTQETGFRDEKVSKSMTSNVLTIGPDASIDDVMEIMTSSRIRHVPVVEDGRLRGLVSIGDVVKRIIADTEKEIDLLKEYIST